MLIGIILLFPASIFGGIKLSWNIFSYNRIVFLSIYIFYKRNKNNHRNIAI